jgi:IS30 family transposase
MKTHQKFTPKERDLLAKWLAEKVTKSECARRLKRPRRSVIREVKRNGCWLINREGVREFVYIAITAQAKASQRWQRCAHNKQALKNPDIYDYVTEHLRGGWSPEQIEGRLKEVDHPSDPHWQITHETIYTWIYDQPKNEWGQYWYEYLRRKQKKRKKQRGRTVHRVRIPERISISKRPEAANQRTEVGHWEGDSIEGKRGLKGRGLHTEVERLSRKVEAEKVRNLTSRQAYYAQCRIFNRQPQEAVKSTTLDNGRETHEHYRLRKRFNMMTYHAHPYASFERGTNEHGNWHLRYYFPKGTDFAKVTRTELQAVVEEINNRPRKIHHFLSANEVYYQLVKK